MFWSSMRWRVNTETELGISWSGCGVPPATVALLAA